MRSGAGWKALRGLRSLAGLFLMLSAGGVLIEGGLSRYAAYGLPPHANWKAIAFGLVMLGTGAALFRPAFFMRGKLK